MPVEPGATAFLLAVIGLLLGASVLVSRAGARTPVPVTLLFLCIGLLAGSEGLGRIAFSDYHTAYRLGVVALALILFDGGLNTPVPAARDAWRPAALLATVGVAGIAGLVGLATHLFGVPWPEALILGAVVSSTDAAAVFNTLRQSGIQLKRQVGAVLELESGLNDPMAVILTATAVEQVLRPGSVDLAQAVAHVVTELAIGLAGGVLFGLGGRRMIGRSRLPASGLYAVLSLALAALAFGATTLAHGSGFLAVYIAGMLLGAGHLPYRASLLRIHDALAWLAQIAMFLLLGLLAFPSRLVAIARLGTAIAVALAIVIRPVVVFACLAPFRGIRMRERGYIGWVGLRGAVPIVLATYPVLAGVPGAEGIFDLVFFVVVVSAFLPGSTVAWVTRRFGLERSEPPRPPAILEVESRQPLSGALVSYQVDPALPVAGVSLSELPLPEGASVALVVRGRDLLPARGTTVLEPGDHVYLIVRPEDESLIELMFGRSEEG
ncbi:MAG TPA: potassium/proton antiporter [Gemmatimonadales bacterium]|nr:potassium/proton antiporter [Gemmatimonadales bacterium]